MGIIIITIFIIHSNIILSRAAINNSLLERLNYKGAPPLSVLTYPTPNSEVLEGNSQVLSCEVEDIPPYSPRLIRSWIKDGGIPDVDSGHAQDSIGDLDQQFLRIVQSRTGDAGRYQCSATNSYGSALSAPLTLSVSFLHDFVIRDTESWANLSYTSGVLVSEGGDSPAVYDYGVGTQMTFNKGSYTILKSPPIAGAPHISFTWYKDGRAIHTNPNGPSFDSKDVFSAKYHQITINPNSPLKSGYHVSLLVIYDLSKDDEGAYKCVALNPVVGKVSETIAKKLIVVDGRSIDSTESHIILKSQNLTITKGLSQATFYCLPFPKSNALKIKWFHRGNTINDNSTHYTLTQNGYYFTINNPDPTDTGPISCQLDRANSPTYVSTLLVAEKPAISGDTPSKIEADYNTSISMVCETVSQPAPQITWFYNSKPLTLSQNKNFNGSTLLIKAFTFGDDGVYQCFADNFAGTAYRTFWIKMINYPPVVIQGLKNDTILYGSNMTLNCIFASRPQHNITWLKNEIPFQDGGSSISFQAPQNNYTSLNISCIAANYLGKTVSTAHIHFIRNTRIVLPLRLGNVTHNNNVFNVVIGEGALLPCLIDHDYQVGIMVAWYKGNTLLVQKYIGQNDITDTLKMADKNKTSNVGRGYTMDTVSSPYSLRFDNARNTDKGVYKCHVTSRAGDDEIQVYLQIVELPYPPLSVVASIIEPTRNPQVRLRWVPNFNGNSPVLFHTVQYEELGVKETPWHTSKYNYSGDAYFAIIKDNLDFGTSYAFRLRAVNGIGLGSWSETSNTILVPIITPNVIPKHLISKLRSPTSILLKWQVPKLEVIQNHILGYVIRYRLSGFNNHVWNEVNLPTKPGNEAQYLLENLIAWKQYSIGVAVFNKVGVGPFSNYIDVWTTQGVPEIAPENLEARVFNSTSALISWISPDPQLINGLVSGFKIRLFEGIYNTHDKATDRTYPNVSVPAIIYTIDNQDRTTQNYGSNISSVITGLKSYTSYYVDVNCFTNGGDGPYSSVPFNFRTLQDVPGAVGDISVVETFGTVAIIRWTRPLNMNGVFRGYKIKYGLDDTSTSHTPIDITADINATQIELNNLMYSRRYTFNISALTEVGEGPSKSMTFTSSLMPTLPSHPIVKNLVNNATQANVTLEIADMGNSILTTLKTEAQTSTQESMLIMSNDAWTVIGEVRFNSSRRPFTPTKRIVVTLKPNHYYRLRFIAENEIGQSIPSQPTSIIKTESTHPKDIHTFRSTRCYPDNSCITIWDPLASDDWNGISVGYSIHLFSEWESRNITIHDPLSNFYQMDNLIPLTNYTFVIHTINHKYVSLDGMSTWIFTYPSKPLSVPQNIMVSNISSKRVDLSFICHIKLYEVIDVIEASVNSISTNFYNNRSDIFHSDSNKSICSLTISDLKPFTSYGVTLNYRNFIGRGGTSLSRTFQTSTDLPDKPLFTKFVMEPFRNSLIITWLPPKHPNGDIVSYELSYKEIRIDDWEKITITNTHEENLKREVFNLIPETEYEFAIRAKTGSGWGHKQIAKIYNRKRNYLLDNFLDIQNKSSVIITLTAHNTIIGIQKRAIKLMWETKNLTSIPWRYFMIRYKYDEISKNPGFGTIPTSEECVTEYIDPDLYEFELNTINPASIYYFQIKAVTDLYETFWYGSSKNTFLRIKTPSSTPSQSPKISGYKLLSSKSVSISWMTISKDDWNSEAMDYAIFYKRITPRPMLIMSEMASLPKNDSNLAAERKQSNSYQRFDVNDIDIKEGDSNTILHLSGTETKGTYAIYIRANNEVGHSSSDTLIVYIGDPLPRAYPSSHVTFVNSTAAKLILSVDITPELREINPYALQIRYRPHVPPTYAYGAMGNYTYELTNFPLPLELNSSLSDSQVDVWVMGLKPYTRYEVAGALVNFAGVGLYPNSPTLLITNQSLPGPPSFINFTRITMDSLVVIWGAPYDPNGIIEGYIIKYHDVQSPHRVMEKNIIGNETREMNIENLKPFASYIFDLAAINTVDYSIFIDKELMTGPQKESPPEPSRLTISHVMGENFLMLEWKTPPLYEYEIEGYYLQGLSLENDHDYRWKTVTNIPRMDINQYALPLKSLAHYSNYTFRLQSWNTKGVSNYSHQSNWIQIDPEMLAQSSGTIGLFYNQWWFLIIIALSSAIVILLLISWLCCKSRDMKYKRKMVREVMGEDDGNSNSILNLAMQNSDQGAVKIEHLTHDNTPGYLNPQALHNPNYASSTNTYHQTEAILRSSKRYSTNRTRSSNRERKSSIRRLSQQQFSMGNDLSGVIYPEDNDSDAVRSTLQRPIFFREPNSNIHTTERHPLTSFNLHSTETNTNSNLGNTYNNEAFNANYNSSSSIISLTEKPSEANSFVLHGKNYLMNPSSHYDMNLGNQSCLDSDPQSSLVSHYTNSYVDRRKKVPDITDYTRKGRSDKQKVNSKKGSSKFRQQGYRNNGFSSTTNSVSTFSSPTKSSKDFLTNNNDTTLNNNNNNDYQFPSAIFPSDDQRNIPIAQSRNKLMSNNRFDMMTAGTRAPLPPMGSFV